MFWFSVLALASPLPRPQQDLVVHEWGTFTAVADAAGDAVQWRPLLGPSDLPSFTYGPERPGQGLRVPPGKGGPALVRMETPVIYFYTPVPRVVQVSVTFPDGQITEWYPRARTATGKTLDWGTVQLRPFADEPLPNDGTPSHYYPARNVASATVEVCSPLGDELERFLFYRGLGDVPLTVHPTFSSGGQVHLSTSGRAPARILLFERRGDSVGFTVSAPTGEFGRPVLDDSVATVRAALRTELVGAGLYGPEAEAMLATWDGDWFEDGLRVLYLVPRAETDDVLPLTVSPAPDETVRVLVGRIEVPTPEALDGLRTLLAGPDSDDRVLAEVNERYGRFAEPWLRRVDDPRAARLLARFEGMAATPVD